MTGMPTAPAPIAPIDKITSPFVRFARIEAAGAIVLLTGTLIALVWANSPWQETYHHLLETPFTIGFGRHVVTENRHEWVNDGLMSLFFFLVGLEIKREILVGELSSMRRAVLPLIGALGGMIVPALLYLLATNGTGLQRGWAIPISTDIAFALGLLAVLGSRVPPSLKIFVTALAIVDDIFSVLIIAVFYTTGINYKSLLIGLGCIVLSSIANLMGVRKPVIYAMIGICAWFDVLNSGVHATIAGILLAFTIPAETLLNKTELLQKGRSLLNDLEKADAHSFEEHSIIYSLEEKIGLMQSPVYRIEHQLQPFISFLVVPLFAFANAGVNILGNVSAALRQPLTIGIALGLVLGKPIGILLFSYLAVKSKLASPLPNVTWGQVCGAGFLCGIGFTMSLFVATLAFGESEFLATSKIAILGASLLAGIAGAVLLTRRPGNLAAQEN
jgi:Na+:H+ antiporter, NhaA family